jgi:hypothetical protein
MTPTLQEMKTALKVVAWIIGIYAALWVGMYCVGILLNIALREL